MSNTKKIVLKAKKFQSREELEAEVLKIAGDNVTLNRQAGHTIEGTAEDLGKLLLGDTSTVYGFKTSIKEK